MTGLDWFHNVRDVPAAGLAQSRTASPDERSRVAAALELLSLDTLGVSYRLTPTGGGRYRLSGRIEARLAQACVVTLDPVHATVAEPFEVMLVPAEQAQAETSQAAGEQRDDDGPCDLEAPLIEPIHNGVIDIGRIVIEELTTSLDPYPRLADATMDRTEAGSAGADSHPFAKLAGLRDAKKSQ